MHRDRRKCGRRWGEAAQYPEEVAWKRLGAEAQEVPGSPEKQLGSCPAEVRTRRMEQRRD